MTAGIGLVLTPVEFIKCQMQCETTAKHYASTMHCLRQHIGRHPASLFTGLSATWMREIPGTFVYFVAYHGTTRSMNYLGGRAVTEAPSNWTILSGGAVAGLSFWGLFYPIDLIKSQMQTQEAHVCGAEGPSVWRMMTSRVRQRGMLSMYNGFSVTVPRAIISNACLFFVYESCRKLLDETLI